MSPPNRRLHLALPMTVLTEPGTVRLVGGEDLRYALRAPEIEAWLPGLLASLDGQTPYHAALSQVPEPHQAEAEALLQRLVGERLLVEAPLERARPEPAPTAVELAGRGPLFERFEALQTEGTLAQASEGERTRVLCQDRLDYAELEAFNARCLAVLVGDAGRVTPKYGQRALRFLLLEAGHLIQSLCLVAESQGLGVLPLGGACEPRVAQALRLPRSDAVLYLGALGRPEPA